MLNRGVAFGIGQGIPVWGVVLALVVVIIIAVKTRELWRRIGLILMIIGGGSNLYMRVIYGGVLDNMRIGELLYNNLWDYLIVAGLVIYGYSSIVRRQ